MGVDAIPDAKDAVGNGSLSATVLQDAVGQGEGGAKVIHSVLQGKTPEGNYLGTIRTYHTGKPG